jgi:NAD(P)H-dependent FMN reductase
MILGIVGSYRKGGTIDQAVSTVLDAAATAGAATRKIYLLELDIAFCINCRRCTQEPGQAPGECFHRDDMSGLIEQIENAEAFVLGAPVNFGNANALTQRFLERLVCYSYWPWGQAAPKIRKGALSPKPAILITASAMPAILARLLTGSLRGLKLGAKAIGAKPVATIYVGQSAMQEIPALPERIYRRAQRSAKQLAQNE